MRMELCPGPTKFPAPERMGSPTFPEPASALPRESTYGPSGFFEQSHTDVIGVLNSSQQVPLDPKIIIPIRPCKHVRCPQTSIRPMQVPQRPKRVPCSPAHIPGRFLSQARPRSIRRRSSRKSCPRSYKLFRPVR